MPKDLEAQTLLTRQAARALTDDIKTAVGELWAMIVRAYERKAWRALGYDTWDDYVDREFGQLQLRLPRERQQSVMQSMHAVGMSAAAGAWKPRTCSGIRQIAAATGVSQSTASRMTRPESDDSRAHALDGEIRALLDHMDATAAKLVAVGYRGRLRLTLDPPGVEWE